MCKADCSRVTHPSAATSVPKDLVARLACVRHAASVRPEPGSNSRLISVLKLTLAFIKIALDIFCSDFHRTAFFKVNLVYSFEVYLSIFFLKLKVVLMLFYCLGSFVFLALSFSVTALLV